MSLRVKSCVRLFNSSFWHVTLNSDLCSLLNDLFSLVTQSCPTLCYPMDCSTPGLSVHHQLPHFAQTHGHRVSDTIQPSHPLSSPSPPAFNLSQHQGRFKWGGQSVGVSASASVLPVNIQDWFPLGPHGPRFVTLASAAVTHGLWDPLVNTCLPRQTVSF